MSRPTLVVERDLGSPGSSVFDLPSQKPVQQTSRMPHISLSAPSPTSPNNTDASYVVISGGTGGNAICSAFGPRACYVLPVSDDGGSSAEIIRVIGGPSIGDIRSRLVRLIPSGSSTLDAIRTLLAYRLPADERIARDEWRDIVEGRSLLWRGIPHDRKETIRGFLVHFESDVLKRAHKNFTFVNGSIGNYLLAGAQGFFRSLPASIFLFSSITNSQANILPVIVTNHTVTIAAELENGEKLVGQCEISHPVPTQVQDEPTSPTDGIGGGPLAQKRTNVLFSQTAKDAYQPLNARIARLYYINAYGFPIHPTPNPEFLSALTSNEALVYSCGSLWTSIMPCLALRGVAAAVARSRTLKAKVLLLNAKNDRETEGYTAVDYITAIVDTLNAHYDTPSYGLAYGSNTTFPVSAFITDLVLLKGTQVAVDQRRITNAAGTGSLGTSAANDAAVAAAASGSPMFGAFYLSLFGGISWWSGYVQTRRTEHFFRTRTLTTPKTILSCTRKAKKEEIHIQIEEAPDASADAEADLELVDSQHLDSLVGSTLTGGSSTIVDVDVLDPEHHSEPEVDSSASDADATAARPRPNRVRFRSRVRITSGLHSYRHKQHQQDPQHHRAGSVSSLASSVSVSSSLSAPLRSPPTAETSKPGWGTLGTRVGLLAAAAAAAQGKKKRYTNNGLLGERSALLGGRARTRYDDDGSSDSDSGDGDGDEILDDLSKQIDLVFGPWPWRLVNRHWWWWQLQPIVCCGCLDEDD
ncbi:hypothetical protein HMN09_00584400 [Mycena chlorophos]|uniref:Uncharacterized protein n=1 Tax=Mycena chlorophos TaxID=658473 RepID=A0A8H6W981_MYCCL|nr:hypothetical protein HMN09_00584400 [Mycena chlorophos]